MFGFFIVSEETIYRATFNYWEPSFFIEKDGRRFTVYHTKYPVQPEPNPCYIPEGPKFSATCLRHIPESSCIIVKGSGEGSTYIIIPIK